MTMGLLHWYQRHICTIQQLLAPRSLHLVILAVNQLQLKLLQGPCASVFTDWEDAASSGECLRRTALDNCTPFNWHRKLSGIKRSQQSDVVQMEGATFDSLVQKHVANGEDASVCCVSFKDWDHPAIQK